MSQPRGRPVQRVVLPQAYRLFPPFSPPSGAANGRKCLWQEHSVNEKRPLLSLLVVPGALARLGAPARRSAYPLPWGTHCVARHMPGLPCAQRSSPATTITHRINTCFRSNLLHLWILQVSGAVGVRYALANLPGLTTCHPLLPKLIAAWGPWVLGRGGTATSQISLERIP